MLEVVTGDANIAAVIEGGYHGAINSIEASLSLIESQQNNDSFIYKLEDAVKVTISTILTSFLSCSISPFIPQASLDTYYKEHGVSGSKPINIPTHILDFSNTLHVSPVSESGKYFYDTSSFINYYKRDSGTTVQEDTTVANIREKTAEKYTIYQYQKLSDNEFESLSDEQKKLFKKFVSVSSIKVKQDETPPAEYVYTVRSKYTAESLYKTNDMNAFIWYVANRGDNTESGEDMYEYNKMVWDSRRLNLRDSDTARNSAEDWDNWLKSRKEYTEDLYLEKDSKKIETLYPILQMEPSESWGDIEHLVVTFPAQRYVTKKKLLGRQYDLTKTIYKFNADYLQNIKIFNWKSIIMNLLYELNGISPIPDVKFNLSLSDEIIDARLSTLILDTITADDKEVDDSYYFFSNEDYSEALKKMELQKYGAKPYQTVSSAAIQKKE